MERQFLLLLMAIGTLGSENDVTQTSEEARNQAETWHSNNFMYNYPMYTSTLRALTVKQIGRFTTFGPYFYYLFQYWYHQAKRIVTITQRMTISILILWWRKEEVLI